MKLLIMAFLLLTLSACSRTDVPQFPQPDFVYQIDAQANKCGRFKIVSMNPFKISWFDDVPMINCDGYVAIAPSDFLNMIIFKNDAEVWFEKHKSCF